MNEYNTSNKTCPVGVTAAMMIGTSPASCNKLSKTRGEKLANPSL